ncbi:MAG TPA: aminotransferase class III-fold pyridoxal phosphate-dependent enzyme [Chitinophagaceae bacterium]
MNLRQLFLQHVAQTSESPLALEIVKAEGSTLYDASGKEYLDLIGGISVANIGHRHPEVVKAIKKQLDAYMHVMVYGEFIESPQVQYAKLLTEHLPANLDSVYFTNSGAEAVEGAMKLAKRYTNRTEIIAFNKSYHGSTQGALSVIGDEYWRNAFRPLLPGIQHLDYNSFEDLDLITESTACVIAETVQAEAGIIAPGTNWIQALRSKCDETGALLVLDEIQAGFGRTGKLWGFQHFHIVPDILLLGKALGGGMPLGAFITSRDIMLHLTSNPVLGHITTFGGHPVSCAAGMAAFRVLLDDKLIEGVESKVKLFLEALPKSEFKSIRSFGLWMAIEFEDETKCKEVINTVLNNNVLTDWFLFAPGCLRISPPLIITNEEIQKAAEVIIKSL